MKNKCIGCGIKIYSGKEPFCSTCKKDFEDEYKDEVKRWNLKTIA